MDWVKVYYTICYGAKKKNRHLLDSNDPDFRPIKGHHIIPVCAGGQGDSDDWDHPNIAPLYARENYICHLILPSIYSKEAMWKYNYVREELQKEFDAILQMPPPHNNRSFERWVTLLYTNPNEALKQYQDYLDKNRVPNENLSVPDFTET